MKFIEKGQEPASLATWKNLATWERPPTWADLQNPQKSALHDALCHEQGHICCYCNRRIGPDNSHVEHIIARSREPSRALDYGNLLASCGRDDPPPILTCGHSKGGQSLPVTPLQPDCETRFYYTAAGEIRGLDGDAMETTRICNLNADALVRLRAEAMRPVLDLIGDMTQDEFDDWIRTYSTRDAGRNFPPFCMAVLHVLRAYR
jgi:uncharacterized protein (TIGR02646 family)